MPSTSRIDIRLAEEEKQKAQEQAKRVLGDSGTISEYIRLIINLDAATGIIEVLRNNRDYKPRGLKQFDLPE
jgi:uncharacterized protein YeeX (DUF496 family)